jgi:hypothetical protein
MRPSLRSRVRLQFETLEVRCVPTAYTVDLLSDTGAADPADVTGTMGDLRYCITQANTAGAGATSTISFGSATASGAPVLPTTIPLMSQLPTIAAGKTITITGGTNWGVGRDPMATGNFAMFAVDTGAACNIWQLSIGGGTDSGIKNSGGLTLGSCTISDNDGRNGGGINNNGGSLFVYDSVIAENFADVAAGKGGGIYNTNAGTVTCWETTITENWAFDGGGIYNWNNSTDVSSVDLDYGTEVTANMALNNGGGIYNLDGALTMNGGAISGNQAVNMGAGVYQDSAFATSQFNNVFITNNQATAVMPGATTTGGGMCLNGGSAAFFGCTLYTNSASVGDQIAFKNTGTTLYVDPTTFIFGGVAAY